MTSAWGHCTRIKKAEKRTQAWRRRYRFEFAAVVAAIRGPLCAAARQADRQKHSLPIVVFQNKKNVMYRSVKDLHSPPTPAPAPARAQSIWKLVKRI